MEIELKNSTVPCCREISRQTKMMNDHIECVVPDVLEDIGKISFADVQLFLKGKEITAYGARITASLEATVFYISDSFDKVRSVKLSKEFFTDFENDEITPDSYLIASLTLQGLQPRLVNARKISLQFSAAVSLEAWTEDQLPAKMSLVTDENYAIQLLETETECVSAAEITEKTFAISEQFPLEEADSGALRLVCSDAKLIYTDHQMIGSKVLLKGCAEFHFGYETEHTACPCFSEKQVSFSVLIDAPGEACEMSSLVLQPTALYAEIGEAINGEHVVETELHATAQIVFSQRHMLHYITDAYSTRFPAHCLEASKEIGCSHTSELCEVSAEEKSEYESAAPNVIVRHAEILSTAKRDGKATACVIVGAVMEEENGALGYMQKLLNVETPLPADNSEIEAVRLLAFDVKVSEKEVVYSAKMQFAILTNESRQLQYVRAVELDSDTPLPFNSRPALVAVRRKNRSLWDLAKQYGSSSEAIEEMCEKYDLPSDLLLIPRI